MTAVAEDVATPTRTIPLGRIYESVRNTRQHYDKVKLRELAASMKKSGQFTPALVRPTPPRQGGAEYEIAAGHRRFRAAQLAGLPTLLCVVREMDDAEFLQVLTIENLQREDLHPLDEAHGFQQLLALPGFDAETIAVRVGKSPAYVAQQLKLLDLSKKAVQAFLDERILLGHARILSRLQPADQDRAIAELGRRHGEFPSVGYLREWLDRNVLSNLSSAPFPTTSEALVPSAGSCAVCPKRTGHQGELLAQVAVGGKGKAERCLDRACWTAKVDAHFEAKFAELARKHPGAVRVSTAHEAKTGVLPEGKWWRSSKQEKGAVAALVVSGYYNVGEVLWVVTNLPSRSRITRANPYAAQERRNALKRKREASRRLQIYTAVAAKLPTTLDEPALRAVVAGFLREMTTDTWRMVAKALGVEPVKGRHGGRDFEKPVSAAVAAMDPARLTQFLQELPLLHELVVYGYSDNKPTTLLAAAAARGVDVAAIDRALDAEAKAKAKEKKKPAAKRAKKGDKPAAKAKAAKAAKSKPAKKKAPAKKPAKKAPSAPAFDPDAHPCESCGCTVDDACAEGCSWDPQFEKQGRAVCSQCASLVRKREGTKREVIG